MMRYNRERLTCIMEVSFKTKRYFVKVKKIMQILLEEKKRIKKILSWIVFRGWSIIFNGREEVVCLFEQSVVSESEAQDRKASEISISNFPTTCYS